MTSPFWAVSLDVWNHACICIMQLIMDQKGKVISRRNNCFLRYIFDFITLCCTQMLQVSGVSPCLMTVYTLQFSSLIFSKYSFVLGSFFLYPLPEESLYMWFQNLDCTKYKSLVCTLLYEKTLVCSKKKFLLKCRYWRDDYHKFAGKPFGLEGEEGWSRGERSKLSFKTCTAFKFPY